MYMHLPPPLTHTHTHTHTHRLWGSPMDQFDSKLNMDHLQQCMAKLLRDTPHSPTQPLDKQHIQYEAFYLLINLGDSNMYVV